MNIENANTQEIQALEFSVGNALYAINISLIQEIVNDKKIHRLPMGKSELIGVLRVRDEIYSCIDLNKVLYDEFSEINENTFYVLVKENDVKIAFIINKVNAIITYDEEKITPSSSITNSENIKIKGIITIDDKVISLLNIDKVINSLSGELKELEEQKEDIKFEDEN